MSFHRRYNGFGIALPSRIIQGSPSGAGTPERDGAVPAPAPVPAVYQPVLPPFKVGPQAAAMTFITRPPLSPLLPVVRSSAPVQPEQAGPELSTPAPREPRLTYPSGLPATPAPKQDTTVYPTEPASSSGGGGGGGWLFDQSAPPLYPGEAPPDWANIQAGAALPQRRSPALAIAAAGGAGFFIGGPVGALLGAVAGYYFSRPKTVSSAIAFYRR